MGFGIENVYVHTHYQPTPGGIKLVGITPGIHRGDQSKDATAPSEITGSDLFALRTATTQADFDVAMTAAWSAWSNYSSQFGAVMFAVVVGLPG